MQAGWAYARPALWWVRTLCVSILVALVTFSLQDASAEHLLSPPPGRRKFVKPTKKARLFELLESARAPRPTYLHLDVRVQYSLLPSKRKTPRENLMSEPLVINTLLSFVGDGNATNNHPDTDLTRAEK